MKVFGAKYRGLCKVCDATIHPGDEVGYDDDELIHEGCAGNVPIDITRSPFNTRDTVCPVCSLEHKGPCF